MRSLAAGFILVMTFVLVSCGSHGNDNSNAPDAPSPPPTTGNGDTPASPTPPVGGEDASSPSVTATIGPQGASLGLTDGTQVEFGAGALSAPAVTSIFADSSEAAAGAFVESAGIFGPLTVGAMALLITIEADTIKSESVSVKLPLSDELLQLAAGGQQLALFTTRPYELDGDDDKSEAIDVVEAVLVTVDTAAKVAHTILPDSAFDLNNGKLIANLRIAALPTGESVAAAQEAGQKGVRRATPLAVVPTSCPGDASFAAPMLYGWRKGVAAENYYDTIAGILGPFAEAIGHEGHAGHPGIDFFADVGTPVYAVAGGYIEQVVKQGWTCTSDSERAPVATCGGNNQPACAPFPRYWVTLAVTNKDGIVTDRVTYQHIKFGSVKIGGVIPPHSDLCWHEKAHTKQPKFQVDVGDQIAETDQNGTVPHSTTQIGPHLHLEWKPVSAGSVRNPMCKLSTIFPGRIEARYSDANQAELGYRMYGWAPPGLAALLPGRDADNLVEFWVRRKKPAATPSVCLLNDGPNQIRPCDWGGRGAFMYPLERAIDGNWEELSRAEVARVDINPPFLGANPVLYYAKADQASVTQLPTNVGVFVPSLAGLAFPTQCGATLNWTWSVTLPFDVNRTSPPVQFGPTIEMQTTWGGAANCTPLHTQTFP